jgi:hypothetical protein
MTRQNTTTNTTSIIFFSPTISPRHIFDKGVRKAMVQQIYRQRKLRQKLNLKAMQWFPNRGPLFSWMPLITMRFLCTGVVGSNLAQPLIQKKRQKLTFLTDRGVIVLVSYLVATC